MAAATTRCPLPTRANAVVGAAIALAVLLGVAVFSWAAPRCAAIGYSPAPLARTSVPAFAAPNASTVDCAFMRGAEAVVFLHTYPANAWRAILDDTVTALQLSPLRACGVRTLHGIGNQWPYAGVDASFEQFTPSTRGRGEALNELHTLAALHDYCTANPRSLALYLHSKGTRISPVADATRFFRQWDWRRFALYFLVEEPRGCIAALLDGYDACGVNKRFADKHLNGLHYSGNFWWARCEHVASLPNPFDFSPGNMFSTELYIGHRPGTRLYNCFDSGIDHYWYEFSRANYVGARCERDVPMRPYFSVIAELVA